MPRRPLALTVVAGLFILGGLFAAAEVFAALLRGHVKFDLDVLKIFAGLGLLRYSAGWRTFALVLLWIGMIGSLIVLGMGLGLSGAGRTSLQLFGAQRPVAPGFFVLWLLAFFAFTLWQYRVLVRPDVRRLFLPEPGRT